MCVNYIATSKKICFEWFRTPMEVPQVLYDEAYFDFNATFIVYDDNGQRQGRTGCQIDRSLSFSLLR